MKLRITLRKIIIRVCWQLYCWIIRTGIRLSQRKTKPIISEQPNIYYSIKGYPFDLFLDFYCDGNYQALLKYDKADIINLVDAGEKIKAEFFDCSQGMSGVDGLKDIIRLQVLESRITRIQAIVDSLQIRYSKELAETLRGLGIRNKVRPESIEKDLKRVVNEAQKYVLESEQIMAHLKSKNIKTTQPERKHFENILIEVDPTLRADEIDTYRFCVMYQKLKRQQERANNG